METDPKKLSVRTRKGSTTRAILRIVNKAPGSLLRIRDLKGLSPAAAAKALARLTEKGVLQRVGRGLYYVPKETLVGKSRPSEDAVERAVLEQRSRPKGVTAANLLGLSTQMPAHQEVVAYVSAKPKGVASARVTVRAVVGRKELKPLDAALLEFLRDGGRHSEFDDRTTQGRLRELLGAMSRPRLWKLQRAALDEPARVRAMLGALLQWMEAPESLWRPLKKSLSPYSRFNFGLLRSLPNSKEWQAK